MMALSPPLFHIYCLGLLRSANPERGLKVVSLGETPVGNAYFFVQSNSVLRSIVPDFAGFVAVCGIA